MTAFRDDIDHSTAAHGVSTSEGLEGAGGGWDFVTERKRGIGRAGDIEKARKKVREIEREKVSAHNLHSLFSAPFNPLESSPPFVDVSLRVRLSFFPTVAKGPEYSRKTSLTRQPLSGSGPQSILGAWYK